MSKRIIIFWIVSIFLVTLCGCEKKLPERPVPPCSSADEGTINETEDEEIEEGISPEIDLSNWKITLPIFGPDETSPVEVEPPAILDYASNPTLDPFLFNDTSDTSLVFYTFPGSTTTNSSFSRTELREQIVPGSNSTNWTFAQGGYMRGTLSVPEISLESDGDPHRTMIMQIHGRLTNEQRDLIGASDNNAPPILKILWQDGIIRVKTKELIDLDATLEEMLETDAWQDDDGRIFATQVDEEIFTLEVVASDGQLVVTLNDDESFVYDNIHMEKWGVFENYFKAGNYLQTTDEGAFSYVKYYDLEINHD